MANPVLVVGASLAGLRAAGALRNRGYDGELVLLGQEPERPYDRPPLSKEFLAGDTTADALALREPDDLNAEWLLGRRATGLDLPRRRVTTDVDGPLPFSGLVIATGVRPRVLPGWQPDRETVFTLRTLADAAALGPVLRRGPRLLVIGAGFIGVEVAATARRLGCPVTVVSNDPPIPAAGGLVSATCRRLLTTLGVRVLDGVPIERRDGGSVTLADGTRLDFDVALVAVGSLPNTEWLAGSGLDVTDGVLCDVSCAAIGGDGTVVAAGDVARWPSRLFGGALMRVEHWSNAVEQGAAAARTLLDGPGTAFAAVPAFWSDHGGPRLHSVGLPALADRFEPVEGDPAGESFALAAYRGEDLVGALAYGLPRALARYRVALSRRQADPAPAAT